MLQNGLNKIYPHTKDYSLLHTFGAIADPKSLPQSFSIYDGRSIPNQNNLDTRFTPALSPIPYGCTGESLTFAGGLEDATLYNPYAFYLSTPPHTLGVGRDIRDALQTAIDIGYQTPDGQVGNKRFAYFNCYGAGAIDDFDAARIGVWINQNEKRGVIVGTWWYWGEPQETILPTPSFKTSQATLHCYLVTGWDGDSLEVIPWVGQNGGNNGRFTISRSIWNALMAQPFSGAFTITKMQGITPIPIGYQTIIDHLVYFIKNLFQNVGY